MSGVMDNLSLEQQINIWIKEPGLVRRVQFDTAPNRLVTCYVSEGDSQPEYYSQTFRWVTTKDLDAKTAFLTAIKKLRAL